MNMTYEEMSPAMQKAYRSTNIARKVTLFLSIALIVIVSIGFLRIIHLDYYSERDGSDGKNDDKVTAESMRTISAWTQLVS